MIDKLIAQGEEVKKHTVESIMGNVISGDEFNTWIYKSILFVENKYPSSKVTAEIKRNSNPTGWNNNDIHRKIMAALKATKELESE